MNKCTFTLHIICKHHLLQHIMRTDTHIEWLTQRLNYIGMQSWEGAQLVRYVAVRHTHKYLAYTFLLLSNLDSFMNHRISSLLLCLYLSLPKVLSPFQPPNLTRGNPPPIFPTKSEECISVKVSKKISKLNLRMFTFERERLGGRRVLRKRKWK